MKSKNILFVCKYNRFRSRVAEAYFKKINKKNISAFSAGVFRGDYPLDKQELEVCKKLGINIEGKPKNIELSVFQETRWFLRCLVEKREIVFEPCELLTFPK